MTVRQVIAILRKNKNRRNIEGMARYGIVAKKAFGISAPRLHALAKKIGTDHALATKLWATGIHDARIVAALVADPDRMSEQQMERWVRQFDNWAVCDTVCGNVFDRTPYAVASAIRWSKRKEEFVKRAGYVLMATLAVHDKEAKDATFVRFLPHIFRGSADERNYVKKGVNWALRQIGKRNLRLYLSAIRIARRLKKSRSNSARWIGSDALREFENPGVMRRILQKRPPRG